MPSANDKQVGGKHYANDIMQHWDIVVAHNLDYFQAQILRYTMRWNKKDGVQDLRKAQHFLEKYIEVVKAAQDEVDARVSEEDIIVSRRREQSA